MKCLREFIGNNKSIKHLTFVFGFPPKPQNYILLLSSIYGLSDLSHLNIDTREEITSASLGIAFNQMPSICSKLKSLRISDVLVGDQTSNQRLIEELKKLKHLKRLDLTMSMTSDSNLTSIEEHFNECFKHLEGLTHLRLKFPDSH